MPWHVHCNARPEIGSQGRDVLKQTLIENYFLPLSDTITNHGYEYVYTDIYNYIYISGPKPEEFYSLEEKDTFL